MNKLLPFVQYGYVDKVNSILSEISTGIDSCETSDDNDPVAMTTKPVFQTGETSITGSVECKDSPESECVNITSLKPVSETSKTGFSPSIGGGIVELNVMEETVSENNSTNQSDRSLRQKRRNETKIEPPTRKKQRTKEGQSSSVSMAMGIGGEMSVDASVLMETGVNNCNILHVCCGGTNGYRMNFDPNLG